MTAFTSLRTALKNRAAYLRTKRELEALSREVAIEDLGLYPGDAARIARKAVYG